jgi:hypothetical protein
MTRQQIAVDMLRPIIKECHSTSQGRSRLRPRHEFTTIIQARLASLPTLFERKKLGRLEPCHVRRPQQSVGTIFDVPNRYNATGSACPNRYYPA